MASPSPLIQETTNRNAGSTSHGTEERTKIINDPVHGSIEMNEICMKIIDTPQFQRLRQIKHLGGCYLVYPGATHNRFEHSIGVCHLAGEFVRQLQKHTTHPDIQITEKDVLCVEVAGLCHDLGHGPFSHVFEKLVLPKLGVKWKHEDASVKMFDYLLEKNPDIGRVFQRQPDDPYDYKLLIKEMIDPQHRDNKLQRRQLEGDPKEFLYEIVANGRNEIDVDKWDYFARDSMMLGLKNSFDHIRYMKLARICHVPGPKDAQGQWQICMRDKEAGNVHDMFYSRMTLFQRAYYHKVTRAVELMIADALCLVDKHIDKLGLAREGMTLSTCVKDMETYMKLKDNICDLIMYHIPPEGTDEVKEIQDAKMILKRIEKRELYKCIAQATLKKDANKDLTRDTIKEKILQHVPQGSCKPSSEHFEVLKSVFNHGKGGRDPTKNVRYYTKHDPERVVDILRSEVSHMLPAEVEEKVVLVYCKFPDDQEVCGALEEAFKKWCPKDHFETPKIWWR